MVEEEVRAVHLRCLHAFWHKHRSGLSQRGPVSFVEWGQLFVQLLLTLGRASQHGDGKEDAQGHREVAQGGRSPDTAVPRRGYPLFYLGQVPVQVRTSLCLLLQRLGAIPWPSGGTYRYLVHAWGDGDTAHPMGQLPAS